MAEDTKPNVETNTKTTETVAVPEKKKSNKTLWIVLGVVLLLFVVIPAVLITAGGLFLKDQLSSEKTGERLAESLIEGASGGKVDVNAEDGSYSIESEDGTSSIGYGDNQKLPEDFPKDDIPYLKEKAVTFVITSENEGKQTWSVTTSVDESYEEATAFFEDRIKSPEYSETSNFGFGDSKTFYGVKDSYTVSVSITRPESGDTTVTYMIESTN